jgi:hypothetical protein
MAKKKPVNKTQTVCNYIHAHPGIANKEVADALTKQGIKITANHVANIKGKMDVVKGKRSRRRTAANAMSVKTGVGINEIKAAFALLKLCGGINGAREALAAAVEIQKIM